MVSDLGRLSSQSALMLESMAYLYPMSASWDLSLAASPDNCTSPRLSLSEEDKFELHGMMGGRQEQGTQGHHVAAVRPL